MGGGFKYPSILIIGHGELGLSIVKSLHSSGSKPALTTLTILARPQTVASLSSTDPAKYSLLDSWNIHWLPLDIEAASNDELKTAFTPFTAIIHASGMFTPLGIPTKITRAAMDAGVKYFVPWQFGVNYDAIGPVAGDGLFAEQFGIRKILRQENLNMKWNIISSGLFTSFVFFEPFGIVNADKSIVRALGGWDNKVTLTAAEDIGVLTAKIVYERMNGRGEDGIVYIGGDTVTYKDIADAVEDKVGKSVERRVLDLKTLKKQAEKEPDNKLTRYQIVFGEGEGCSWEVKDTYNEKNGIKAWTLREWMDTHKF
ncbi:hypothetical protein ABW19_dt0205261 [Dactylella cylindrospora]|nr:hypothetical protein ABW19_dt0205261 [Dactylella cylindrospora]